MQQNQNDTTSVSTENVRKTYEMAIHKRFFTEALRSVGYTPDSAKFELIANSLDAGAKNIHLFYDEDQSIFSILDDGKGMSFETLLNSMGFGVNRDYGVSDTGYFGMGMKTGIINLMDLHKNLMDEAYIATIETNDGNEKSKITYQPIMDPTHFTQNDDCSMHNVGTQITIHHPKAFQVGNLKNNIAVFFNKALSEGKAKIFVHKIKNGEMISDEVQGNDPLYRDNKELSRNFTYAIVKGTDDVEYEVKVEAVALEEGKIERHSWDKNTKGHTFSLKKSGIYVIYGDQYVETGGTFDILAPHPVQNYVRIEFIVPKELTDVFPIKFNKTGGLETLDKGLYPKLTDLNTKIKEMFSWGLRIRAEKGLVEADKDILEETNKIMEQINKAADQANLRRPKEERGPRGSYSKDTEQQEPKKAVIKKKKTYDVKFEDFQDSSKFWYLTTEKGRFVITFNISHPFYTNTYNDLDTKGKKYMLETLAAFAQAQYSTLINEIEVTDNIEYFWEDFFVEMSRSLHRLISNR